MTAVFDLDDTICRHRNRDYPNAAPILPTVEKLRRLKEDGWEIVIYSSRGQNSCHGDLPLTEERNRATVETWLKEHDIPYDRVVFGKPLGDLYVDDKGVSLLDFMAGEYRNLGGNSGEPVFRLGDRVIKQSKDARKQADWYAAARSIGLKVPRVNSVVLDKIDVEYLDGEGGEKRKLSRADLHRIVRRIMDMSDKKDGAVFDLEAYKEFARSRLSIVGQQDNFPALFAYIDGSREQIERAASFCHGDLSLSNVIFVDDVVYLIDPSGRTEFSSFLMDFAKLRFSLDGGEELLHGMDRHQEWDVRLAELDGILSSFAYLKTVKAMETVHWVRMLRYFEGQESRILRKAKELEAEL